MTTGFKTKLATYYKEANISTNPGFILDVFRHLEIENYFDFFVNELSIKIIKKEEITFFVHETKNKEFIDIVKTLLEIFEYCNFNNIKRSETKPSLIGLFNRLIQTKLCINLTDKIINFHNQEKPHKKLSDQEFEQVIKISTSRYDNKKLFPLDMLTDVEMLSFFYLDNEEERQKFIENLYEKFSKDFRSNYKKRSISFSYPEDEWIYFNFKLYFISFKWSSSWSKHKAFVKNWVSTAKTSIVIFQKNTLSLTDSELSRFQNI